MEEKKKSTDNAVLKSTAYETKSGHVSCLRNRNRSIGAVRPRNPKELDTVDTTITDMSAYAVSTTGC